MNKEKFIHHLLSSIAGAAMLLLSPFVLASFWASSVVPPHGEEALTWCGHATAQMIMEGYPAGGCTVTQTNIASAIATYKVEPMWDVDPAGLRGAMLNLCPLPPTPPGSWSIYANADPAVVMHAAAKWMTKRSYPAAVLLNTSSHNSITTHQEHWAAIQAIRTDLDPTTNSTVTLEKIIIVDPDVPYTTTPAAQWIDGADWPSEYSPVSKVGSTYLNKHVAIIEPPVVIGRVIFPLEILTGILIPPEIAIQRALNNLRKDGVYELDDFKLLLKLKPIDPLLVNKDFGGYYLIPFNRNGEAGPANAAVLVNAYTGSIKQVKVYKQAVNFLGKQQAIDLALKYIGKKPKLLRAELVYQRNQAGGKFFPIWQVYADTKKVGVDRGGKIITRVVREEHALPLPGVATQGVAWDNRQLLVMDGETKKIYKLDPYSGRVSKSLDLPLEKPKGMTFDGQFLWVADEQTKKIHSIDPNNGQIQKTFDMPIPEGKGFKSFEDLAWDGKYLWTAYFAGFSSTFNQIDPQTGKIIKSVFANCHPRGIASDGNEIWSLCYNGEKRPTKIDRRKILDKEHDMLASRTFIETIDSRNPGGLELAGNNLWYIDKKSKKAFRIKIDKEKQQVTR